MNHSLYFFSAPDTSVSAKPPIKSCGMGARAGSVVVMDGQGITSREIVFRFNPTQSKELCSLEKIIYQSAYATDSAASAVCDNVENAAKLTSIMKYLRC